LPKNVIDINNFHDKNTQLNFFSKIKSKSTFKAIVADDLHLINHFF